MDDPYAAGRTVEGGELDAVATLADSVSSLLGFRRGRGGGGVGGLVGGLPKPGKVILFYVAAGTSTGP